MQSNEITLQDNNESFGLRLVWVATLMIEYVTITELYLSAGSAAWLLDSDMEKHLKQSDASEVIVMMEN